MVASLLSVVTSGPENKLLNSNTNREHQPDVAYYLRVHRRQTRYGRQPIRLEFSAKPNFGLIATAYLPIKGELLHDLHLVLNLPDIYTIQSTAATQGGTAFRGPYFSWTNGIGHTIIAQIDLEIAGAVVASLDGRSLEILDELTNSLQDSIRTSRLIHRQERGYGERSLMQTSTPVVVKIPFWFTQHIHNALPLDAMAVDPVRIHITFRPLAECYYTTSILPNISPRPTWFPPGGVPGLMWPFAGSPFYIEDSGSPTVIEGVRDVSFNGVKMNLAVPGQLSLGDTYLIADYIFLDRNEARIMRESELTYTVKRIVPIYLGQLPEGAGTVRLPLRIPGMLQDLMWVIQRQEAGQHNAWNLFTRDLATTTTIPQREVWWPDASGAIYKPAFTQARSEPLLHAVLRFKHLDRIDGDAAYFRAFIPAMYFKKAAFFNRYVYAATVAADPLALEATGQANMDKIVDCELELELARLGDGTVPALNVYVYATTVSVFKVYGGRGGFLW